MSFSITNFASDEDEKLTFRLEFDDIIEDFQDADFSNLKDVT